MVDTINYACMYYPCHNKDKLQSCVFCYCPLYPCGHPKYGKHLENGIWDCSNCVWPHDKVRIDEIYTFLKSELIDDL